MRDRRPFERVIDETIVRTKDNKLYAVKCTKFEVLISNWMDYKTMREYIIENYPNIWFYLTNKMHV